MVEACAALAEGDDVVYLGGDALALGASDLAQVPVTLEDLQSHRLPRVVVR